MFSMCYTWEIFCCFSIILSYRTLSSLVWWYICTHGRRHRFFIFVPGGGREGGGGGGGGGGTYFTGVQIQRDKLPKRYGLFVICASGVTLILIIYFLDKFIFGDHMVCLCYTL